MMRWFKSDAGRWFTIGAVSASLLSAIVRGPYDSLTMTITVVLLAALLVLLTIALHGVRRPWLRTLDMAETPDGDLILPDIEVVAARRG